MKPGREIILYNNHNCKVTVEKIYMPARISIRIKNTGSKPYEVLGGYPGIKYMGKNGQEQGDTSRGKVLQPGHSIIKKNASALKNYDHFYFPVYININKSEDVNTLMFSIIEIMPRGETDPIKFYQKNRIYISFNLKPVVDYLKLIPVTTLLSINRYSRESNTPGANELNKILGNFIKDKSLYQKNKNSKDKSPKDSSPFVSSSSRKGLSS